MESHLEPLKAQPMEQQMVQLKESPKEQYLARPRARHLEPQKAPLKEQLWNQGQRKEPRMVSSMEQR